MLIQLYSLVRNKCHIASVLFMSFLGGEKGTPKKYPSQQNYDLSCTT